MLQAVLRALTCLLTAALLGGGSPDLAEAPSRAPVAVLASRMADELARVAGGRALEVGLPGDSTSRGGTLAVDLHGLLLARLAGRVEVDVAGPRLRVESSLSETASRLVLSARLVEEPGGRLLDVLSVSVDVSGQGLALTPVPTSLSPNAAEVLSAHRSPPIEGPVLALAWLGEDRLAALLPEAVLLLRWDGQALVELSRRSLPTDGGPVRRPGGLLRPLPDAGTLWAATSLTGRALSFSVERDALRPRGEAQALPWPGCQGGLRFLPGTDLLEGEIQGLGAGPFLALDEVSGLAVLGDGTLRPRPAGEPAAGPTARVGGSLAALWPGLAAAASAEPPGRPDSVVLLAHEAAGSGVLDRVAVEGTIRALAARPTAAGALLLAAVEGADGPHLLVLELGRRAP